MVIAIIVWKPPYEKFQWRELTYNDNAIMWLISIV